MTIVPSVSVDREAGVDSDRRAGGADLDTGSRLASDESILFSVNSWLLG